MHTEISPKEAMKGTETHLPKLLKFSMFRFVESPGDREGAKGTGDAPACGGQRCECSSRS
ncbi:MAG: hypothetical protein DWQ34_21705 [Planctomycetota bacterium]|nr:MAG: hypothetical protein DWQ29_13165 [Planctomycetota bacterium]REJ88635.1 MAG: hypothetical protein DWQ34_21705 [Planctomycetota bacterium]REK27214.1 MAG: hypothetical protein DWQ41_07505 [Planctomycetota bacterium]REK36764.1 MAG: hypothetical protein DWQ45_09130 [Planctomycetota bacterium]